MNAVACNIGVNAIFEMNDQIYIQYSLKYFQKLFSQVYMFQGKVDISVELPSCICLFQK